MSNELPTYKIVPGIEDYTLFAQDADGNKFVIDMTDPERYIEGVHRVYGMPPVPVDLPEVPGVVMSNVWRLHWLLTNRIPPCMCDMSTWFQEGNEIVGPTTINTRGTHRCGSVGCMAGWACAMLAPMETYASDRLVLNLRWKEQAGMGKMWDRSITGVEFYAETAEKILGHEFAPIFSCTSHPRCCGMNDHRWMVEVLAGVLKGKEPDVVAHALLAEHREGDVEF